MFTDFPSFFHHFNIPLYLCPISSSLLSQRKKKSFSFFKAMTPSFLISSHHPNIHKHRCERVCLCMSLFTSCYHTKHVYILYFLFVSVKPWSLFHTSTQRFKSLYRCRSYLILLFATKCLFIIIFIHMHLHTNTYDWVRAHTHVRTATVFNLLNYELLFEWDNVLRISKCKKHRQGKPLHKSWQVCKN